MKSDDAEEIIKKYGPAFARENSIGQLRGTSRVVSVFTKACTQLPVDHGLFKNDTKLRHIVASLVRDSGPGYTIDFLESPAYMQSKKYIEVARAPLQYTWDEYVNSLFKDHPGDMLCIAFISKVLECSVIVTSHAVNNKTVVVKPFISNNSAISISLDWSETDVNPSVSHVEVRRF